jgi:hypothetical protein
MEDKKIFLEYEVKKLLYKISNRAIYTTTLATANRLNYDEMMFKRLEVNHSTSTFFFFID